MSVKEIVERCYNNPAECSDQEIIKLLEVDCHSDDFYHLISASNRLSRSKFGKKAYIFVQIGLNAEPCSGNCVFCSLGKDHYALGNTWRKSKEEIISTVISISKEKIDDIFLMCTADYPFEEYISIIEAVRPVIDSRIRLVANIGDFSLEQAKIMKRAGVTGVYHVNRLREGIDTSINVIEREKTLEYLQTAELETYYCIEPIGAEHSYDEILVEIRRAQALKPEVMAVMRRVSVENTPIANKECITAIELTKIAAVSNLVVQPSRAMNLHETEQMSLLAGINQLYAEYGANPRDTVDNTQNNRAISVNQGWKLFNDADLYSTLDL